LEYEKIERILKKDPEKAVEELLKEVKKVYGEIPYIFNFMREMPELLVPKILYDSAIIREFKRLDPKTIELISIAVSAALRCNHCLRMHIRVAQRLGISKEEIFDAVLIAGSLANASVLADSTRVMDEEKMKAEECEICDIPSEKEEQE